MHAATDAQVLYHLDTGASGLGRPRACCRVPGRPAAAAAAAAAAAKRY